MSARRRCAWACLLLGWAAVITVPDIWDLGDGLAGDLCDAGAVVALALLIVKLHTGRGGVSRVQDWRHASKIRALEAQGATRDRRLDGIEKQLAGLNQAVVLSHAAAGRQAPPEVGANAPTQPQLRIVG